MISLRPQLTPSELLCCDELPPFIKDLLEGACSLYKRGELSRAERCALDAIEASKEAGGHISRGVALVHLADMHRDMGRLGPALADSQQAHRIFQRQASHYQRHNEAVAAYALGLVHQSLGNDMDAMNWYQGASELLERVKDDWIAVNALTWVETCTRVQKWIKELSDHLTAFRTRPGPNLAACLWIPIVVSGSGGNEFAIAELEVDRYRVERELTVGGRPFCVKPLRGRRRVFLEPGLKYYALKIPDAAHASWGTSQGDYALIGRRREADREGPGVVETLGELEFGHFERGGEGDISFVGLDDRIVLGGEDIGEDLRIGYIAALLRPSPPASESPAPPPSEPPAPPPSEQAPQSSAASADAYGRLLGMVGGDEETAKSLIEHERNLKPDASRWELIESAIERLVRDRQ